MSNSIAPASISPINTPSSFSVTILPSMLSVTSFPSSITVNLLDSFVAPPLVSITGTLSPSSSLTVSCPPFTAPPPIASPCECVCCRIAESCTPSTVSVRLRDMSNWVRLKHCSSSISCEFDDSVPLASFVSSRTLIQAWGTRGVTTVPSFFPLSSSSSRLKSSPRLANERVRLKEEAPSFANPFPSAMSSDPALLMPVVSNNC